MTRRHDHSKESRSAGFGVAIVLALLFVVVSLGLLSWVVYNKLNDEPVTANQSLNQSTQNTAENMTSDIRMQKEAIKLSISEWGVALVPAKKLPNMSYELGKIGTVEVVKFSFEGITEDCNGYHYVARAKSGQDIDGYGTSPEKLAAADPSQIKQVGEYFYRIGHGQAPCTADDAEVAKLNQYSLEISGEKNTFMVEKL